MATNTSVPRAIPPLHHLPTSSETGIIDIRSSDACLLDNLDTSILDGLSQPHGQKSMPALLLWDEKGQTLYDKVLATEEYYPYRVENELIQERVDEMATTIAASRADLLVELGAGNMTKTGQLLSSLDKRLNSPMLYCALDVDRAQLERSLVQLNGGTTLRWIKLCGLLGTYDDGARWLAQPDIAAFRRTLVWLGSSIANYEQDEAGELLNSFTKDPENGMPQNLAGFLLLVDGCQDATKIDLAYDVPGGETRRWMLYALEAARRQLYGNNDDHEVDRLLADEHWRFEGQWHPVQQRYENYLVPTRKLTATIRGRLIQLDEGERVRLLESGKWNGETMSSVALKSGLDMRQSWRNGEFNYGAYWLQPIIRRHDSGIDMTEMSEAPSKTRPTQGHRRRGSHNPT
ncbi:histidine-specific methyltransferase [Parachaetomium inaequale]|uniref:Histidine-specific methyltransferase n=1 Tax=Parachaetomium inaequale TaxID=2588326 RepID=A0AAN6PMM5_9PEZI|nr:histidine-specific methyltransferase [Parachaetomium inaequale]